MKTPWSIDGEGRIRNSEGHVVLWPSDIGGLCGQDEIVRRIVGSANACAGVSTESLMGGEYPSADAAHRDGYMAAVDDATDMVRGHCDCTHADIPGIVGLLRDDPTFGYKGRGGAR